MKKLSASIGVSAISLIFAGAALAQTNAPIPAAPNINTQVREQIRDTVKAVTPAKPDTRPLEAAKRKEVEKRAQGLVTSSEKIIGNTEKQISRTNELISKFEAKGASVAEAKRHIGLAVTKISEAKTKLEEVKSAVKAIPTATNPRDAVKTVQDKIAEFREVVKESHVHVVEAVSSLRNAVVRMDNQTPPPSVQ